MPYFLRHYATFVDRMTFFDDESTDTTRQIIATCPKAFYQPWPGSHGIVDDEFTDFANEKWKEARGNAEWIIWVDADEFIYHPTIMELLARYLKEGVDHPRVAGFTMLSDRFPTTAGQIYDEIRTGIPDDCWSKQVVFRSSIAWHVGKHSLNRHLMRPRENTVAELKLLHYRGLGLDYVAERHARNWARVPEHCRIRNYGNNCQPGWTDHHGLEWFREILARPRMNVI